MSCSKRCLLPAAVSCFWLQSQHASAAPEETPAPANEDASATRANLSPRVRPLATRYDGVYGRFAGDFALDVSVGAEYRGAEASGFGPLVRTALHYYQTVSVALEVSSKLDDPIDGRGKFGLELAPGFLLRWVSGLEQGPPVLDLTLDSLTLAAGGATWTTRREGDEADSTLGVYLGGGFAVPLQGGATGWWLTSRSYFFPLTDGEEPTWSTLLAIGYQGFWESPLVAPP